MADEDWRAKMERQTDELVARFVQENLDYTADAAQPTARGQANCVVFGPAGRVVFKNFCEADRQGREVFALRHWRRTGLVPELLGETDELVVMSFFEGELIEDLIGRVDTKYGGWRGEESFLTQDKNRMAASTPCIPVVAGDMAAPCLGYHP